MSDANHKAGQAQFDSDMHNQLKPWVVGAEGAVGGAVVGCVDDIATGCLPGAGAGAIAGGIGGFLVGTVEGLIGTAIDAYKIGKQLKSDRAACREGSYWHRL